MIDILLIVFIYFIGYFLTVYYINKRGLSEHLKKIDMYYNLTIGWPFWVIILFFVNIGQNLEAFAEDLGKIHKK